MDEANFEPMGAHCPLRKAGCRSDCAWLRTYSDPNGRRHACCSVAFTGMSRDDAVAVPIAFKEASDG